MYTTTYNFVTSQPLDEIEKLGVKQRLSTRVRASKGFEFVRGPNCGERIKVALLNYFPTCKTKNSIFSLPPSVPPFDLS